MQKLFFISFMVLASFSLVGNASKPSITKISDSEYALSVGEAVMVVNAEKGAQVKTLSLSGKQVIATENKGTYSTGSTFWPSPQADWNWPPIPEIDNLPYQIKMTKKSLICTSNIDETFKYRVIKEYSFDKKSESFSIKYTLENTSNEVRKVAPWEISRVPNSGIIFFEAKESDISPNDIIPFQYNNDIAWFVVDAAQRQRKVFVDAKGWLAHYANGILFLKQFEDITTNDIAPKHGEVEVYVHQGVAYIELENQGKYVTLKPGEKTSMTVKWYVKGLNMEAKPSAELKSEITKLIK